MKKKVEKSNPIIAYKGFNENLCSRCFGFQYEVGKEYHLDNDDDINVCCNGFHACQNPLDVFVYYPISSYTRYAMVMLWGDVDFAKDGKNICATDIMIVKEIGIDEMVTVGIMASMPKIKINENDETSHDRIISRKNSDSIYNPHNVGRVASCGNNTSILSKGYWQKIASSGDWADIDAIGECAEISTNGRRPIIKSNGINHHISTSGYASRIISHGHDVSVSASDRAEIYSDGKNATLYASCMDSQIASIGDNANICISSINGYVNSCGSDARIMSAENLSTIESTGENALVMSAGRNTRARAKVGSWIVLTEYDTNYDIKCVKAEYVDGERIKGDTLYMLVNGEFVKAI